MFILKLATLKKMPDKKTVLRGAAVEGCTQLFEGFQLAFEKKRIFNVKSAPLITIDETLTQEEIMKPGTYTWDMFKALLKLLEKNELDDETKKKLLYEVAEEAGVLEWNAFYRPIVMKNLKCGVTAKTINGILDEFGVESIKYKIPIWKIKHLHNSGLSTGKSGIGKLRLILNEKGVNSVGISIGSGGGIFSTAVVCWMRCTRNAAGKFSFSFSAILSPSCEWVEFPSTVNDMAEGKFKSTLKSKTNSTRLWVVCSSLRGRLTVTRFSSLAK